VGRDWMEGMIERRKAEFPLWLFWGQPTLTWMRYLTPVSACAVHGDVRLVIRSKPVRATPAWAEEQDFQMEPSGPNLWPLVERLPLEVIELADVAPEIAAMEASDIHTADLLGWHLMAEHGGACADMDVIFFDALPPITNDVMIPIHKIPGCKPYAPIGYIAGRPCETWKGIMARALERYHPNVYQSCGAECVDLHDAGLLPATIVYPFAHMRPKRLNQWMFDCTTFPPIPENCVGLHWYGGGHQAVNQKVTCFDDLPEGAVKHIAREVIGMAEAHGWPVQAQA
jgi:hypothetical protein